MDWFGSITGALCGLAGGLLILWVGNKLIDRWFGDGR